MSHFKAFYNDWLDCSGLINSTGENCRVNLDPKFFADLKFDNDSLKKYRIDAAIKCAETLGNNPVLCFSGGVDSQAMLQCWREAGLEFTVAIMTFDNNLNKQDSDHAKMFCEKNNYSYIEIPIDIVKFLTRDNFSVSEKYKSFSPQFNTHYRMIEILRDKGFTGICCGGVTPYRQLGYYGTNFTKAVFHFLKIQELLDIPCQGSFLSFYPELTWAIAMLTESFEVDFNDERPWDVELQLIHKRYLEKIKSYTRAGFDIIPQQTKFTGFELVTKYFEKTTGDGWAFERRFRHPIVDKFDLDKHTYQYFELTNEQLNAIESCYFNIVRSNRFPAPGIRI